MTQRILFVCLGNICRSPTAEAVTRAKAQARGLDVQIDSAGTAGWHIGKPPYGPMQDAARPRGYDLSDLRARQVRAEDFRDFDLIVTMDGDNMDDLSALAAGGTARLELFTDMAPHTEADHVPDPYFTRDFGGALDVIEICADALLDQLAE